MTKQERRFFEETFKNKLFKESQECIIKYIKDSKDIYHLKDNIQLLTKYLLNNYSHELQHS